MAKKSLILSRVETAYLHFTQRLKQRHGIGLSPDETVDLIRRIKLGQARLLTRRRSQGKRDLYLVAIKDKLLGLVFDWKQGVPVTVLPDGDPRVAAASVQLDQPIKKWLQANKQAKEIKQ